MMARGREQFLAAWQRLAALPAGRRVAVKAILFAGVLLFVLFPNPILLVQQLRHLSQMESLIQPDLPAMGEINRRIDQVIATNQPPVTELRAVERFVYQNIKYQYDWHGWWNLDYWPTAAEVWERKREDCDGRAVLAASILRARGHADARLVANLQHVWVAVGTNEIMGPMADRNLRREGGRTIITFPALKTLLDSLAMTCKFPAWRAIVLLVATLALAFHPAAGASRFFALGGGMLAGYVIFLDWCVRRLDRDAVGFDWNLPVGGALILGALGLAALSARSQEAARREIRPATP